MSNSLPSDEEIRGRVRTAMQDLIVRDSALAADVVPHVQGAVMEIVREFRLAIERLCSLESWCRAVEERLHKDIKQQKHDVARIVELEQEVERLEACADPDALVIVYEKGRAAERAVWRKRMREQSPDDEANMDRYCRGFNDGYEFAGEQGEQVGKQWQPVADGVHIFGNTKVVVFTENSLAGIGDVSHERIYLARIPGHLRVCHLVEGERVRAETERGYMQVPASDKRPPVPRSLQAGGEQPITPNADAQALAWFAEQMARKLAANERKGGWQKDNIIYLLGLLSKAFIEVDTAVHDAGAAEIISECADVANYAMMIADRARLLESEKTT